MADEVEPRGLRGYLAGENDGPGGMLAEQIVRFEVEVQAVDVPTSRRRRNGDPMHSEDASAALSEAVDAFRAVIERHGLRVTHTGYGVIAEAGR